MPRVPSDDRDFLQMIKVDISHNVCHVLHQMTNFLQMIEVDISPNLCHVCLQVTNFLQMIAAGISLAVHARSPLCILKVCSSESIHLSLRCSAAYEENWTVTL